MSEELRPCPFCGGKAVYRGTGQVYVRCLACGARSRGTVELPKDADYVPIHVGDVMEWCDSGETIAVFGVGNDILFYIDGENAEWTAARNKRHHVPDTWERIIMDAVCGGDEDELVARCKRLAGDAS